MKFEDKNAKTKRTRHIQLYKDFQNFKHTDMMQFCCLRKNKVNSTTFDLLNFVLFGWSSLEKLINIRIVKQVIFIYKGI